MSTIVGRNIAPIRTKLTTLRIQRIYRMTGKIISVFGSSHPEPESEDYEQARRVGAALARAGHTVQTGGYSGVMEAASRGAAETGGHVIGVTSSALEQWRALPTNRWVVEEQRQGSLEERLLFLVNRCDGVLVLPGGVGTLAELALTWNYVLVGHVPPRPIITLGAFWKRALEPLFGSSYVAPASRELVHHADEVEGAMSLLQRALA